MRLGSIALCLALVGCAAAAPVPQRPPPQWSAGREVFVSSSSSNGRFATPEALDLFRRLFSDRLRTAGFAPRTTRGPGVVDLDIEYTFETLGPVNAEYMRMISAKLDGQSLERKSETAVCKPAFHFANDALDEDLLDCVALQTMNAIIDSKALASALGAGRARPVVAAAPAPAAEKGASRYSGSLVAVLEFHNKLKGADKAELDAPYFSNAVRGELKRLLPSLRVMTSENVTVLLRSAGKTLADCEGECEVDTGRRLGADLVVSGDVVKVGTRYKLDLRIHETAQGQLLSGTTASGKTVDELDDDARVAVQTLLKVLQ